MNTISLKRPVSFQGGVGLGESKTETGANVRSAQEDRIETGRKRDEFSSTKPDHSNNGGAFLKKGLAALCPITGAALLVAPTFLGGPLGIAAGAATGAISGAVTGGLLGFGSVNGLFYESRASAGAVLGAVAGAVGGGLLMANGLGVGVAFAGAMTGAACGGVVSAMLREELGLNDM